MYRNNKGNKIRCDHCGKFINNNDLIENGGGSKCYIPDSEVSYEEIGFRCKKCTTSFGKIRPAQFSNIEMNSWIC